MPPIQNRTRSRPIGVTILSVIQFLLGIAYLTSMLWALAISSWADSAEGQEKLTSALGPSLAEGIPGIFLLIGIVYLVFGISSLLLSRGYFKGRESARHRGRTVALLAIAFVVFCLVFPVPLKLEPTSPFWTLFVNSCVYIYLGRPRVRAYFGSRS